MVQYLKLFGPASAAGGANGTLPGCEERKNHKMLRQIAASVALAGILGNVVGCSAGGTDGGGSASAMTGSGGPNILVGGGGTAGFSSSNGGKSSSGSPGQINPVPTGTVNIGDTEVPQDTCAGLELEPETVIYVEPVAMYLMLDNSKSMIEGKAPLKWDQAVQAFSEFVDDPRSAGIDFGLQYFHPAPPPSWIPVDPDPFNQSDDELEYRPDECDGVAHAQSAVPEGRLPMIGAPIKESLAAMEPRSNTPTVGALTGAVNFCIKFKQEHPGEECIVVFVTDGQPNGCGLTLKCHPGFTPNHKGDCVDPKSEETLSPIVKRAFEQHAVKTYMVGMEGVIADGFDLLDALARAGGTDCTPNVAGQEACDVTATGGPGLLEALNLIREAVVMTSHVPCNMELPTPPDGESLDPRLVNVELEVRGQEMRLKQVATQEGCSNPEAGWYYDNALAPKEIRTCPQICKIIKDNPDDVKTTVELGCLTDTVPQ